MNTHGIRVRFGKYRGELFTRLPGSYLKWMINEGTKQADVARAEIERRGDTMPKAKLSGHAIDKASLRVRKIWHETRKEGEGLYSWLQRMMLESLEKGEKRNETIFYKGMKLVVVEGEEFPCLKTVMRQGPPPTSMP